MSTIIAPLVGNITLTELTALVQSGPLVWTADGDMVVAQYWDDEAGIDATIKYPGSVLDYYEDDHTTTATLTKDNIHKFGACGRWQLDFEMYPLDHSTLKALVVDTEVNCEIKVDIPRGDVPFSGPIVPEPATIGMLVTGLLFVWLMRRWR